MIDSLFIPYDDNMIIQITLDLNFV